MTRARMILRGDDGFTLIETLVAASVLVVGLIALYGFLDTSVKASFATRQREQATNLARQVLEDARSIPYAQMSPGSIVSQLQAMPGLENKGSGSTWQVERGGTKYTIALKECAIDDGKGGVWGVHVNSPGEKRFCEDEGEKEWKSGEAGPDPQPEDLKRITADISWKASGRSPTAPEPFVHEVETISSAEGKPGLNATGLRLETPAPEEGSPATAPVIVNPALTSLTFSVSSPTGTAAMRWSLEGVTQPTAPVLKSGTTWTFSWAIPDPGVSDGTYNVAVQAIDSHGVLGPPVSIPVTLIRNIPAPVRGLKAGYNEVQIAGVYKRVVELEWQPNEERNIVGYRVYRPTEASAELACPRELATLSPATTCLDENPPGASAKNLTYTVYALYRNAKSEVAQGSAATIAITRWPPSKPNAPAELKATKEANGAVTLTWPEPVGGEPAVLYRIYRGSTEYSSRYGLTSERVFTDSDATEAHKYWVTAVDANMTESSPIGPVEK